MQKEPFQEATLPESASRGHHEPLPVRTTQGPPILADKTLMLNAQAWVVTYTSLCKQGRGHAALRLTDLCQNQTLFQVLVHLLYNTGLVMSHIGYL